MMSKKLRKMFLFFSLISSSLWCLVESATVTYQLREEQIRGTFVGNVERDMLTQGHLDPNDAVNLKYTLSATGNPHSSLFAINETTSTIRTSEKIDRETVCPGQAECQVRLSIAVYRRGEGGEALDLFKLWYAVINISDMNDNAPTFPQPFVTLSVPESVPPLHVLRTSGAEDRDKGGSNSVQEYRLSPQNYRFGLKVVENPDGSSDLGIVIKEQLDRELQESYQLRVVVTDGGYPRRTGSLTVNITVTDINDNRPIFLRSSYNMSVKENVAPGTPVLQVSATDLDSGLNGLVTYSFSARVAKEVTDHFQMDGSTGIITARGALDYEARQQYQFLVEAQDQGSPQLSGAAVVILNVEDVNDNAPQININLTPGGDNVTENEAVGKFIAHVSVSDRDSGQNSMVVCGMQDDHFTLQKFYDHAHNMYKVLLSSPLDYEASRVHRVAITCRDSGDPQLVNSTAFTVHVRDVNDNAPVFSQPSYTASVEENGLDEVDLVRVRAHDPDTGAGGEVEVRLDTTSPPNVSRYFSLNPVTGWLRVRTPLDREDHPRFELRVLASDRGVPSLTSTARVVITVEDQNDEKPYFTTTSSEFHCFVLERQPVGTRVCNLTAEDRDSGRNAHMRFSLVQGVGDAQQFSIHQDTGVLHSRAVFDREQKQSFRLMVKVEDPQLPVFYDLANVTVQVLDDNDNAPVIHYPRDGNNSLNVSYGLRERSLLARVNATDDDEGVFAQLAYLLVDGDPTGLFDLGRRDGALRLARAILPSDVKEHVLRIEVKDGGNPPNVQGAELVVNVVAGNVTFLEATGGAEDSNVVIVIVLVCVTVVLALAVLITICLIRHIDKERQAKRSAAVSKAEEEKMFRLKNQEAAAAAAAATTFMNLSSSSPHHGSNIAGGGGGGGGGGSHDSSSSSSSGNGGGGVGGLIGGGRNKKKEVSFSLDEGVGSLSTSCSGSGNNLSTFKSGVGVAEKHRDLSAGESGLAGQGTVPGPHSLRVATDDTPHLHPVQEEEGCQYMEMLKRGGEDALSESSGETGTSDSGRGGSEDDSHSNRGSAMEPEGPGLYHHHPPPPHPSSSTYSRNPAAAPAPSFAAGSHSNALPVKGRHQHHHHPQPHPHHHYGGRNNNNTTASRPPSSSSSLSRGLPHVSFSGNLEYLGESTTDQDPDFLPPPPPDILEEPAPAPAAMERTFSTFGGGGGGGGTTTSSSAMSPSPPGPAATTTTNSYRSVLHSHGPGSHQAGYGGVSTSLVKGGGPVAPSLPLGVGVPEKMVGVVRGAGRWGSPSFTTGGGVGDEDDRTTSTSTSSGSYILSHEDLPRGGGGDRDEGGFSNMMV
ncbi:protocadherin-1-like [Babylonia areolata]|uniref:protocadherin-1-like n=1 Tax=Babylonia areolata TaxID=304850 RepID=UPI003FD306EF